MKKILISLAIIAIVGFLTLQLPHLFHFQTKYDFGWYNLGMGLMAFPVIIPIGIHTPFFMMFLGVGIFTGICYLRERKENVGVILFRLCIFLWCIAICDYCYWDIADAHVSPNLNYSYSYQQMDHASVNHGNMFWLGILGIVVNFAVFIGHFFILRIPKEIAVSNELQVAQ